MLFNSLHLASVSSMWVQDSQTPVPIGQLGRELAEIRGQVPMLPIWEAWPEPGWLCLSEGRGSIQWGKGQHPHVQDRLGLCPGPLVTGPGLSPPSPTPGTGSTAFCASAAVPQAVGAGLSPHPLIVNRSVQPSTPRKGSWQPHLRHPKKAESTQV